MLSIAYWVRTIFLLKKCMNLMFLVNALPTDRPTDRPTDTASYEGALSHLKRLCDKPTDGTVDRPKKWYIKSRCTRLKTWDFQDFYYLGHKKRNFPKKTWIFDNLALQIFGGEHECLGLVSIMSLWAEAGAWAKLEQGLKRFCPHVYSKRDPKLKRINQQLLRFLFNPRGS